MSKPSLDSHLRAHFPAKPFTSSDTTLPTPIPAIREDRRDGPTTQILALDLKLLRRQALCVPDNEVNYEPQNAPERWTLQSAVRQYFEQNGYRISGQDTTTGARLWMGPEGHEVIGTAEVMQGHIVGYVRTRQSRT